MDVFVAANAGCWSTAKYDLLCDPKACTVAVGARDRAMRAAERKLGGCMVERSHFLPRPHRMTDIAVLFRRRSELSLMRIPGACDAAQRLELILGWRRGVAARRWLMAISAGSGGMPTSEVEARLLVPRQSKCRRPETI